MERKIFSYLVFILILLISFNLSAQDTTKKGTIGGRVVDIETQQPIAGATVRLLDTKLGAGTDSKGNFTIKNIPIGRYSISAKILGYEAQSFSDVVVVTKRTTAVNFELKISPVTMEGITVKAGAFDKSSEDNIISVSRINNEEIRMLPGTPDIFRRLQYIAGVGRTGENSSAMIVRGGDPEENLTLIENLEVFSPFHFSDLSGEMAGSLSIIEPKLVDNVNISTGGFSAKYGDKLSSVSQISIREPDKNTINGDLSVDMAGLSAFASGPLTDNVSWLVAGRRGLLDFLMKMMDEKFAPVTTDFHAKLLVEPSKDHKISFYGLYAQDEMTGTHEDNSSAKKIWYTGINKSQWSFGANWRWLFSQNGYLLVTPYGNLNNFQMKTGIEPKRDSFDDENLQNFYGIKTELFYRLNEVHRFTIGGEYKNISAKYIKRTDFDTLTDGRVIAPYDVEFGPQNSYKFSSFIQYLISPLPWMNFNLGIREDYFGFINKATFNPRFSANLVLSEKLNLNLATGIFTQFPEFYRIFLSKENANLKPATALHYIAGLDYSISPDMQVKAEGYYKALSDLPVRLNDTSNTFRSTGSGYSTGIELTFTKRMADNFYILFNYTYSISKRRDSTNGSLYNFRYDRPQMVNLMATYKLGDWWEFGLSAAYSTGFPYTPYDLSTRKQINNVWYCDLGEKNSDRYPDYFRVDVRVERRFVFASWNFRAYLELWNITNHRNIFQYNYTDGYAKKEGEVLFPFMPMLGLAFEF